MIEMNENNTFLESGSLHWKYEIKIGGEPFYIDFSITDVPESERETLLPLLNDMLTSTQKAGEEAVRLLGIRLKVE